MNSNETALLDEDWLSQAFKLPPDTIKDGVFELLMASSADNKFTDSSIGGALPLNPVPQSNQLCDPPFKGRLNSHTEFNLDNLEADHGQGAFYSEAYDDNQVLLYAELGVPTFTNIFSYLMRSYDRETAIVATTGRSPIPYEAGKLFGTFIAIVSFPAAAVFVLLGKAALSFVPELFSSRYYDLKPTMHTFWTGVNILFNNIALNLGFTWLDDDDKNGTKGRVGLPMKPNRKDIEEFNRLIPGIIKEDGYIDVLAFVNRAQVLVDRQLANIAKAADDSTLSTKKAYQLYSGTFEKAKPGDTREFNKAVYGANSSLYMNMKDFIKNNMTPDMFKSEEDLNKVVKRDKDGTYGDLANKADEKKSTSIFEYAKAAAKEGSRYAIFRIEDPGSVSFSFSNSTGDIPIKSALDSGSSMVRNIEYSLAGGNVLGQLASDAVGYAKDVILGNLDGVTLGLTNVIQALIDGGTLSIPKMVTGSSYNPPNLTFKIPLICTAGDPISRLFKLYLPIAVAINMVAPRATGNASYNLPFIGRFFVRGRQATGLGVVTGLSLTAGTSNLGYNQLQQPLAFELTLTVTDLSDIAAAPVQTGILGGYHMDMDPSNPMFELLTTITGTDLYNYNYLWPKVQRRIKGLLYAKDNLLSEATWGNWLADSTLGRLYGGIAHHDRITTILEQDNRK